MEEQDDGVRNANSLVSAAGVFATNCRSAFVDHYPDLSKIQLKDWEYLMTVAGTGTALLAMAEHFSEERQRELTESIVGSLQQWNERSFDELRDFLNSVTSAAKSNVEIADGIGAWVLQSVREVAPDPLAAHVIGLMLMKTFAGWWT
jgi:hypothetical protein